MPREVAWRLFAREFNQSQDELRGDGEYAPNYVLTPLGAKVNRVLMAGTLIEKEQRDLEESFYRLRVDDRTATFYISVGQYQPQALQAVRDLEPPCAVMVVGKARAYVPEEGRMYVSLKPEVIHRVDLAFVRQMRYEAALLLHERLELLREVSLLEDPTPQQVIDLGGSPIQAAGIIEVHRRYGSFPIDEYQAVLRNALYSLLDEEEPVISAPAPADAAYLPDSEDEEVLLGFLTSDQALDGVTRSQVIEWCAGKGINEERAISLLRQLMGNGAVYQPDQDRYVYVD